MKRETERMVAAFEVWYEADRGYAEVRQQFGVSETSVLNWARDWDWHARADTRDREAAKRLERESIKRRVKVLEDQRRAGELMRRRGTEYLVENKIDTTSDAIRAVKIGIDLERQAEGLPDYLLRVMVMSEDELRSDLERLRRLTDGMGGETTLALTSGERDPDEPGEAIEGELAGPDPVLPAGPVSEATSFP